ncbi:RHS repeat-associated core domain-containing protein [Actinoplanes sp. NPDC048967]|uniref:RHS repeat-associated core domain-containing protein n=1 Tax=Actinoplanes sp. NPDC048967 TaxID=3155269 RepID=UPI0033E05B0D
MLALLVVAAGTHVVTPAGGAASAAAGSTTYAHDSDGRLTAVFDPTGAGRRYVYDGAGNLTSVVAMPAATLAVAEVSVRSARRGATVDIYGTHFTSTAVVGFNGTPATPTLVEANRLRVTVPATATAGPLVVTQDGESAPGGQFSVDLTGPPAITAVTPAIVDPGTSLTVTGTGFSTTPADNTVYLGGTQAVVTAATTTSLTVQAPPFRPAGPLTVRTTTGAGTSPGPVTVAPFPFLAADVGWTGALPIGQATTVTTAVGKVAAGFVPVTAGAPFAVSVTQENFGDCADVRVFAPGERPVWRSSCAQAGDTSPPLTSPTAADYVVVVNPQGQAGSLTIKPVPVDADVVVPVEVDGDPAELDLAAGRGGIVTFSATAGQRITASVDSPASGCPAVHLETPTGASLGDASCGVIRPVTLPVRGTYRLVVAADDQARKLAATVHGIPDDAVTTATVDGPAVSVTTTVAGQRAAFGFAAAAGSTVQLDVSAALDGDCPTVVLRDPGGYPMPVSATTADGPVCTVSLDRMRLPAVGRYLILADPGHSEAAGVVTATVRSVPPDVAVTATVDGPAQTISTAPGQNADVAFTATAQQRLIVRATPGWTGPCPLALTLVDDDGDTMQASRCAEDSGFLEYTPPVSGQYHLRLDPAGAATGDTVVTIASAPADVTATAAVDGSAVILTTTAGQNATVGFPGNAGDKVFVAIHEQYPESSCTTAVLHQPDTTSIGYGTCRYPDSFIDTATLPAAGTQLITLDPDGVAAGTITVTVTSVPPDATAAATVSGAPVTVTTTKPGQDAAVTFSGTAGQDLRFTATATTLTGYTSLRLVDPAGQTVTSTVVDDTTTDWDASLPATGTYRVLVDPDGAATGGLTLTVAPAPPALAPRSLRAAGPEAEAGTGVVVTPPVAATSLTGQILDAGEEPLSGVTVTVENTSARTGADGRFNLVGLPAGTRALVIDGRTVAGPERYGTYRTPVRLRPGRVNQLGFTSYLTPLDTVHEISVRMPLAAPVVLTNPRIPGLAVHLPEGTTVYDADGLPVTRLGITPLPLDRTPVPLPRGVQVPVFYTIQPAGGSITGPGAQIFYPNFRHQRPGTRVNFWHYDAEPDDLDGWQTYGHGTVSADASQVVPDRAAFVHDFDGAMINIGNQPPADDAPTPCSLGQCGDPVDLSTGLFTFDRTDLALPDTLPLQVLRAYNSGDRKDRAFGVGGNDLFSGFLSSDTDELTTIGNYADAEMNLTDGSQIRFARISPGTGFADAVFLADATPGPFYHAVLAWNGDGWNLAAPDGTVYVHGDHMPLQEIRDRHGNTITVVREFTADSGRGSGNVVAVRSPNGRWIHYEYDDADKHVVAARDSAGRTVRYAYGPDGRLSAVTDPLGRVTTYTYDGDGRMRTITDPRGGTRLTNTYDDAGRVVAQTLADGGTWRIAYTLTGARVAAATVTDPVGAVQRYGYDDAGYLIRLDEAVGTPLARTTITHRLDGSHLPDRVTDPLGRLTSISYGPDAEIRSVTAADGTAAAETTTMTYGKAPLPQLPDAMTGPLGRTTRFTYDADGDLLTQTDPMQRVNRIGYLPDGSPATTTPPGLTATAVTWRAGQLAGFKDPLGRVTSFDFDSRGQRIQTTLPGGAAWRGTFDDAGRPVATVSPLGRTTGYTFDAGDNLMSVRDPLGHVTSYTVDAMDRTTSRTDPLGQVSATAYDRLSRPILRTDARGEVTATDYDALGRVAQVGFGRSGTAGAYCFESVLQYTHDAGDRIVKVADSTPGAGTATFGYDAFDRVNGESTAQGSVSYTYDGAGRRTGMTISGQPEVTYGWDDSDALISVEQGAQQATFGYDPSGRRDGATLPGGVTATYGYDAASQLTGVTYTAAGGTSLATVDYDFDQVGRRTGSRNTPATTSAVLPDARGGLLYDAANRLVDDGGTAHTYDAAGNLTDDGTHAYHWNARGQLSSVTGGGTTTAVTYDPLGRPATLTAGAVSGGYRYDGDNVAVELSSAAPNAPPAASYLAEPGTDDPLARTDGSGAKALLRDGLGSVLALAGTPATYGYEPFGRAAPAGAGADANTTRWTSRPSGGLLPAGLQFNRARWYNADQQRFVSPDPRGMAGGDTNLYSYAGNNPTDVADPYGENPAILGGCLIGAAFDVLGTLLHKGQKTTWGDVGRSALTGCVTGAVIAAVPLAIEAVLELRAGAAVAAGLAEAEGAALVEEGVYVVRSADGIYVGQSGHMSRRLGQHVARGKFTQAEVECAERFSVPGGKTQREIAEQLKLDSFGGRDAPGILNEVNPIGDARLHLMPPGYTRP